MRLIIKLVILLLIIACVAHFLIKRPNGQPLIHFFPPKLLHKFPKISKLSNLNKKIQKKVTQDPAPHTHLQSTKKKTIMYKWKDKNGVVHFSNRKNPHGPCEAIAVKSDIPTDITAPRKKDSDGYEQGKECENKKDIFDKDLLNKDLMNEDLINTLFPMVFPTTLPITQVPQLLQDAKGLEQLIENNYKEQLRILNELKE